MSVGPPVEEVPEAVGGASLARSAVQRNRVWNPAVVAGAAVLVFMLAISLAAPSLGTMDPKAINPAVRNKLPRFLETMRAADGGRPEIVHRMGTDSLGRDIYS